MTVVPEHEVDPQFALDPLQIVDVHVRGERLAAPGADRLTGVLSCLPVERDAELCRPLKDVEELAERQIQQGEDDGHGMQLGQKHEMEALHQVGRHREKHAGHRHGEQHHERQQVGAELLHGQAAAVLCAPPHREKHTQQNQGRRNIEDVEDERRQQAVEAEREHVQAEHERPIHVLGGGGRLEVNPAERQREGDRRRQDAAPEQAPVRRPTQWRSLLDEPLGDDIGHEQYGQVPGIAKEPRGREEQLPAAPPEAPRRRFREPHRIAVTQAERGEDARAGVRDERRIEIAETPAAEVDAGQHERRREQTPEHGADYVEAV